MKRIFNRQTIRRTYYHIRHNYLTLNNGVIALAAIVAIGWAWGAVSMMQRNYTLQRNLDAKQRELLLAELQVQTLEYQGRYYESAEYQELSARENLGLVNPGEKVLILPENSDAAKQADDTSIIGQTQTTDQPSNLEQWMDFFLGKNVPSS